jgi:hypothetical protein
VLLVKETLAIIYSTQIVAQYAVRATPTRHRRRSIAAVEDHFPVPTLVPTPQMPLWDEKTWDEKTWDEKTWDEIEWRMVSCAQSSAPRRCKVIPSCIQAPLLPSLPPQSLLA